MQIHANPMQYTYILAIVWIMTIYIVSSVYNVAYIIFLLQATWKRLYKTVSLQGGVKLLSSTERTTVKCCCHRRFPFVDAYQSIHR